MTNQKTQPMVIVAILAVFAAGGAISTVTPALQNIAEAFPDTPYSTILLISTIPSLMLVFASLVSGAIAGTKIKFRTLIITSMLLFAIGGVLPAFLNSMPAILVSRVIFGLGIGLVTPMGNTLVFRLCSQKDQSKVLGFGSAASPGVSIIFTTVAGFLCAMNWHYTFYAHLIVLVLLALVIFFLPEPEPIEKSETKTKTKLPSTVWIFSLVTLLFMVLCYPISLNMSTLIIENNLGDASTVGIILSLFTLGGIIAGLLYGVFSKYAGKFTIPLSILITVLGGLFIYVGNSLVLIGIGTFILGIGSIFMMPAVMTEFSSAVTPGMISMAAGLLAASMNLGGFVSTWYIAFLNVLGFGSVRATILISIILMGVLAVGTGIYKIAKCR